MEIFRKADLHVHSLHSERPSEWFLQRLGAGESYTEPEFIYKEAKERGMDFVTITDHNRIEGSLKLAAKYPNECFTGCEATAYFPEDGCKTHVLVYGINEQQFEQVQKLRRDIYDLRDYLKENSIAHSVAHGLYSINSKLTLSHLEKLILLFDTFETLNGSRDAMNNAPWHEVLSNLTPGDLDRLYSKHKISPFSTDPWFKGFTGGSDDHAGIFIGNTYTLSSARSVDELLFSIRNKKTSTAGAQNNFQGLAFAIYKVAYDYIKSNNIAVPKSVLGSLTEMIFEKKNLSFANELKFGKLKNFKSKKEDTITPLFLELISLTKQNEDSHIHKKLDMVYGKISDISDEFFKKVFYSFQKNAGKGDIPGFVKNLSSAIPGIFLALPFFSSLKHMNDGRALSEELLSTFRPSIQGREKRILWFTDTLDDLNGVSVTLKNFGWAALCASKKLSLFTCADARTGELPPNAIQLKSIYDFNLPYYEQYKLKVPSFLSAIKTIYDFQPTEILISTPGPLGLLGLLAAKLMGIKSTAIYHTDFTTQASRITADESICGLVESYTKWFYSQADKIQVPSEAYIRLLEDRGFDRFKMSLFNRGIDTTLFSPKTDTSTSFIKKLGLESGFNLIYTGRISKDKNLDFLSEVYNMVAKRHPAVNLIIAGDGPYLSALKKVFHNNKRVVFTGIIPNNMLPFYYSESDLLLFPSETDTFGMSVLEAQCCGLPAIVSDIGGPQEIVEHGETGYVIKTANVNLWTERVCSIIEMVPEEYAAMRKYSAETASKKYGLKRIVEKMFEDKTIRNFIPSKELVTK